MSKHSKFKKVAYSPTDLQSRINRAVTEGRFQQALELAKQLYKYEPTPDHLELLKKVYLGRGKELHSRGMNQDAATVLEVAVRIDAQNPAWLELLAVELARCGAVVAANNLVVQVPDSSAAQQIQALAADAAVQKQAAGKSLLTPALHADFDRVLLAFTQLERSEDEAVRANLQDIGLRSPFLEWKLLLRGLQAYYQNDDERARENWQRLSPERTPARLAAPFRAHIDAKYQATQPPATQATLQRQFDHLQGSLVLQQLRTLRAAVADPEQLPTAFRLAEAVLPALRAEAPQMLPRLANCFYWALLETGPNDIPRYRRVFGSPAHDPNFNRLEGLANDKYGELEQAHKAWQAYEKDVAAHPELWPDGQAQQVRALIWLHMGENAAKVPSAKKMKKLSAVLGGPLGPLGALKPLTPAAGTCFERSLELMPDQLEALEALFLYYLHDDQGAKAYKAAQRLLDKFPDHGSTLEAYGTLCIERAEYDEGLQVLQRALNGNPLDRKLRAAVGQAHLFKARSAAEQKKIDAARPDYQTALSLLPAEDHASVLCRWAAAEFKAGDAGRAEELLQQASTHGTPLTAAFCMLTETIRMKLPKGLKTRFDAEFKHNLEQAPVARDVVSAVSYLAALWKMETKYTGAKTHMTKVLKYVDRAVKVPFTAGQIETLCYSLLNLEARKRVTAFAKRGQREYRDDPVFLYLEAMSYGVDGDYGRNRWKVKQLLEKAERLLNALPREAQREDLQEEVKRQLLLLSATDPFGNIFGNLFGGPLDSYMGDFDDGFEEDDEFEDDDDF